MYGSPHEEPIDQSIAQNRQGTTAVGMRPSLEPPRSAVTVGAAVARPTAVPPSTHTGTVGQVAARPQASSAEELARTARGTAGARAATVWQNNQTINALWSINQDRNSWVGVAGIGWVKLSTASDTGIEALTVLGSHAKQMQSAVNYRQEDDGMIHEMYVW